MATTGLTWAKLYVNQATPEDVIKGGEIRVRGSASEAASLIKPFDRYQPERAVVIPAQLLEHAP